jgi:putative PIG3 family NAD(P)H quinone oxidoreductase
MRAIVIREPGGPGVLEAREVPTPQPARGEVRVRVHATAVNRADLLQRQGLYPAPPGAPADIPGLEFAGVVDALGEGVTDRAIGDRVFGITGGGAYAEQLVLHARELARMPAGMSFADAAAVPEVFVTAWDAMVDQGRLSAGETVLVHAAGSGVGTAAVQIGRAVGAHVVGTGRTREKLERARALGLDEGDAIATSDGRFADAVLARTGGRGADVVLDLVGGAYVAEDLACVAQRGRIIVVGTMGGATAEVSLARLMHKRVELRGTVLRARPLEEKILAARSLERHLVPLFERGALRPVVDRVLPLERASEAHAAMHANGTFGKIVLTVP